MKLRNYVVLMVVGIVAMVVLPVAPCGAGWTHLGGSVSSGSPDSDWDGDDGYEYEWDWSYDVTGINRGYDSGGSWSSASMTADVLVQVWSFNGSSVSESQSTGPYVYGDSYYTDDFPYDTEDLDCEWEVSASGTVTANGSVNYSSLDTGDTVDASSSADGDADGGEYGGGYASGSVDESNSGSAYAGVYGEATEDSSPTITETSTTYYASLDFTVSASDSDSTSGGSGNTYTAGTSIAVYVGASASISASTGYSGSASAYADVDFGGSADVYVYLP